MARRLISEVDGGQHSGNSADERRAGWLGWLERQGFRVLRFWNDDVLGNVDGVLATIAMHLDGGESPPP